MANNMTTRGQGVIMTQSVLLDNLDEPWDDLSAGVSIGFPILGIKGGKWHYRFRGEETIIMDYNGRFPTPNVQVIILKAQTELSRTYYERGYEEGNNAPPDCWSSDGVRPDETVQFPINPVCATCPKDAWSSGGTPAAPKAKACSQRRRLVVTPVGDDLSNEAGGGPVLLSVPPGSLTNLVQYGNQLSEARIRYQGVVTELSFSQDANIAFPKIEFAFVRPLDDDEVRFVLELREHEQVNRILNTKMQALELEPAAPADDGQGQPPAAAPRPSATARPAQQASAVRRPTVVPQQPAQQQAPRQPAQQPRAAASASPAAASPSLGPCRPRYPRGWVRSAARSDAGATPATTRAAGTGNDKQRDAAACSQAADAPHCRRDAGSERGPCRG